MKKRLLCLLLALSVLCTLGIPVLAEAGDSGFSDVPSGAWYAEAVEYVRENGLMSGTTGTAFSPDNPASRATLATILYRRAGSPAARPADFPDVAAGVWYGSAAGWAAAEGIVGGYGDGRFGPDDPVTREQLAAMLWRAAGSPTSAGILTFADRTDISSFALPAITWAWTQGIVSGKSGNLFAPKGTATRAELAVMLHRWLRTGALAPSESLSQEESPSIPIVTVQVGSHSFTATLVDHETSRAFVASLPMTVTMGELNGNEKYYYLPDSLPTNSRSPGTIHSGDLMLYGSNCLVLFYETFSSGYSYTPMGRVDDPSGLAEALGDSSVEVTFLIK